MSRSRTILASAAAAEIHEPACKYERDLWNAQEAAHATATTQAQAIEAAKPLLRVCADCPALAACNAWARADFYTGIAAGAAWQEGDRQPAHWVPGHPPKKMRKAA
ncbi:hypothetical protein ACQFYA_21120 [Promicromonospora sp. Marseille-Q5078]